MLDVFIEKQVLHFEEKAVMSMSMPNIPNITPLISLNRCDTINLLLSSIALEEMGLSHLLNAEGEKLQKFIQTSPKGLNDYLQMNESVNKTLRTVVKSQILLEMKLEDVVELTKCTSCDENCRCHGHHDCEENNADDGCNDCEENNADDGCNDCEENNADDGCNDCEENNADDGCNDCEENNFDDDCNDCKENNADDECVYCKKNKAADRCNYCDEELF